MLPRMIGQTVKGVIDRPIGSRHPRFPDTRYTVNYGYVKEYFAADGEPQDVYVLGTDEPLERFEGVVIAVWHRTDDVEDKWIVSLDGKNYADAEILQKIHFTEQFFKGYLIR
ncbi:MAG: inorganic pyrophosphatase [Clostridia bacterium]|nr:inorganic pyrophosphatase [Clostridia bacterium]